MSTDALVAFIHAVGVEGRTSAGASPSPEGVRAWLASVPAEILPPLRILASRIAGRLGIEGPPSPPLALSAGSVALAAAAQAIAAAGTGKDLSGLQTAEGLAPLVPIAEGWDLLTYHGILSALHRSLPPGSPARFVASSLVARSPLTCLLWHVDPGEEGREPAVRLLLSACEQGHPLAGAVVRAWADAPDDAGSWRWRAFLLHRLGEAASGGSATAAACALDAYGHIALRVKEDEESPVDRAERALRDPLPEASALTYGSAVASALEPLVGLRLRGFAELNQRGVPGEFAVRAARLFVLLRASESESQILVESNLQESEINEESGDDSQDLQKEASPWA